MAAGERIRIGGMEQFFLFTLFIINALDRKDHFHRLLFQIRFDGYKGSAEPAKLPAYKLPGNNFLSFHALCCGVKVHKQISLFLVRFYGCILHDPVHGVICISLPFHVFLSFFPAGILHDRILFQVHQIHPMVNFCHRRQTSRETLTIFCDLPSRLSLIFLSFQSCLDNPTAVPLSAF